MTEKVKGEPNTRRHNDRVLTYVCKQNVILIKFPLINFRVLLIHTFKRSIYVPYLQYTIEIDETYEHSMSFLFITRFFTTNSHNLRRRQLSK